MKCVLVAIVACTIISATRAQTLPRDERTLAVFGIGVIDLPANRAGIRFSVKGFGPTMADAIASTQQKLDAITSKLFSLGLTSKDLNTSSLVSGDNFEGKAFLSSSRDYRTQLDVQVTIDSLELVNRVVQALGASQPDQLTNLYFSLKSDSTLKLEARRLAIVNAQVKADLMAKQLGIVLGRPIQIEELVSYSDGDFYVPPRQGALQLSATNSVALGGGSTNMVFVGGQRFNIRAGVRVIFEIAR